ncbi:MAG: hypothetical protein JNL08_17640 [Planctomycetes bacterium]|nr:hypothetical protein [Planctomycetota bacterium]
MHRPVLALSAATILAVAAHAQCLNPAPGVSAGLVAYTTFALDDEGRSAPIDMLFGPTGFPMAGATGPLTHATISSNGVIYPTSGGAPVGTDTYGPTGLGSLRGITGDSARVFPLFHDLQGVAPTWGVEYDTSVAGQFRVLWRDVDDYGTPTTAYSFSATLHASGLIEFSYGTLPNVPENGLPAYSGASIGNAVGTGTETSSDIAAGANSGSLGLLFYESTGTPSPLSNATVALIPNGSGGYISSKTCSGASHVNYGTGCHDDYVASTTETFYEYFADAAVASAALQGNAMLLTRTPTGYVTAWLPGAATGLYVPPSGSASSLPTSDDGATVVTLPAPFPSQDGPVTDLSIGHNGILTLGTIANNSFDFTPDGADMAATNGTGFYSWSDFRDTNTTPVPSGVIKTETVGTTYYVTWENVDHWTNPQASAPSTLQFQLDLATGNVMYVWVTIDTNTTSLDGSQHLVGYTGPGLSADPGSVSLAAASPIVATNNVQLVPMSLSAAPAPVINPSTLVSYTVNDLPEFVPGSGIAVATLFLSVSQLPGGFDLAGILTTVPGCNAYIATLDLDLGGQVVLGNTAVWNFTFDSAFFSPGNVIAAQAVALFNPAFPLANGEAGGFLLSNGVLSTTQPL